MLYKNGHKINILNSNGREHKLLKPDVKAQSKYHNLETSRTLQLTNFFLSIPSCNTIKKFVNRYKFHTKQLSGKCFHHNSEDGNNQIINKLNACLSSTNILKLVHY